MYDPGEGPRTLRAGDKLRCNKLANKTTLVVATNSAGDTLKWGDSESADNKTIVEFGKFGVFLVQVLNLRLEEIERDTDSLGPYVFYELQPTSAAG